MKKARITKLQINMSENALEELETLQRSIDASTKTEVVKSSLKLYKFLENEKRAGAKILIKDKDGKEKEIVF